MRGPVREWLGRGLFLKRGSGWVCCNGTRPSKTPEKSVPRRRNRSRGPCHLACRVPTAHVEKGLRWEQESAGTWGHLTPGFVKSSIFLFTLARLHGVWVFTLPALSLCLSMPQKCVEQGRVSRNNPNPCGVLVVPIGVPSAMPHLLDSHPSVMTRVWLWSSSHIQWTFHVFEALAMFQALNTVCTSSWVSPIS